jgi:hypothetical protein
MLKRPLSPHIILRLHPCPRTFFFVGFPPPYFFLPTTIFAKYQNHVGFVRISVRNGGTSVSIPRHVSVFEEDQSGHPSEPLDNCGSGGSAQCLSWRQPHVKPAGARWPLPDHGQGACRAKLSLRHLRSRRRIRWRQSVPRKGRQGQVSLCSEQGCSGGRWRQSWGERYGSRVPMATLALAISQEANIQFRD